MSGWLRPEVRQHTLTHSGPQLTSQSPLFPFKVLDPDLLTTFRVILHNSMRNELKIVTILAPHGRIEGHVRHWPLLVLPALACFPLYEWLMLLSNTLPTFSLIVRHWQEALLLMFSSGTLSTVAVRWLFKQPLIINGPLLHALLCFWGRESPLRCVARRNRKNAFERGLYFTFSLRLYARAGIEFDSLHTTLDVFTHLFPVAFEWDLTSPKSVWRINKPDGKTETGVEYVST